MKTAVERLLPRVQMPAHSRDRALKSVGKDKALRDFDLIGVSDRLRRALEGSIAEPRITVTPNFIEDISS